NITSTEINIDTDDTYLIGSYDHSLANVSKALLIDSNGQIGTWQQDNNIFMTNTVLPGSWTGTTDNIALGTYALGTLNNNMQNNIAIGTFSNNITYSGSNNIYIGSHKYGSSTNYNYSN